MSRIDSNSGDEQFFPVGLHALLRAQGWFDDLSPTVVSGPHASGKSNMGGLLGDCWRKEGGVLAANAASFSGAATVTSEAEVSDWAASVDVSKLIIFEEFQSHLPFHLQERREPILDIAEKWAEWGVKAVFISHRAPDFNGYDDVTCIEMQDRRRAEVSGTISCGGLSGIPQTTLTYDVAEMPEWTWNGGDSA